MARVAPDDEIGELHLRRVQLRTQSAPAICQVGQRDIGHQPLRRFDERFNRVDAALLEERQYTEFAFERLDAKIEHLDTKVDRLDMKVDRLDTTVERLDTTVERLAGKGERLDGNVSRIERKLDQFIDTQTKANELVERRLQLLESETQ